MGKLKVGVIGVGNIAESHISAYQKNERVELRAFCDIDEKKLKEKADMFQVKNIYTNLDEMLAKEDIDAVSVCTMNSLHAECAIKALNAGKHVLVEKPMATNAADAEKMKKAADENGVLLMVGFVCRFGADALILKDFIDAGKIGDIYYAKASYLRRHGCPGGWFQNKELSGGGPLIDLGVHVIDLTRYLAGCPKPVSVYGATFSKLENRPGIKDGIGHIGMGSKGVSSKMNVEDFASAMIRYDNGFVLYVESSFTLNTKKNTGTIEIFGTKAGATLEPFEIYTDMAGHMVNVEMSTPVEVTFDGLFGGEINHFVSCILDGIPCQAPAEDGVILMKILDAIYLSAQTGHEVIL